MSENDQESTQPFQPEGDEDEALAQTQRVQIMEDEAEDTDPNESTQEVDAGGRPRRWRWVLGALAALIVFVGLGALGGAQAGLSARQGEERLRRAVEAVAQFELGQNNLNEGQCDIALQRFEYVIKLNPSYPGAAEKLAEALLCATGGSSSGDATPILEPEATATPDFRGAEEIFSHSQTLAGEQNWDELLGNLDTLRNNYPDFMPIEVDGLYYIALRNRGAARILSGDLEGGIYDLNRAGQIGPIDTEADNYRQWASWYITGQSFWEVDWAQAATYFELVAAQAPNLHDSSFFTAVDRLATAQAESSSDFLREAERLANLKLWCDAESYMQQAEASGQLSEEAQPTAQWISENCAEHGNEE